MGIMVVKALDGGKLGPIACRLYDGDAAGIQEAKKIGTGVHLPFCYNIPVKVRLRDAVNIGRLDPVLSSLPGFVPLNLGHRFLEDIELARGEKTPKAKEAIMRLKALEGADFYSLSSGTYKDPDASIVLRTSSNELTLEKDSVFIPLTKDFLRAFSGIKEADQMLGKLEKRDSFINMAEFNSGSEVYDLLEKINSILLPAGIRLAVPGFEKAKVLINMPEVVANYITKDKRSIQAVLITSTPVSEIIWKDLKSSGYGNEKEMKDKFIALNPFDKSGYYPFVIDESGMWHKSVWFEVLAVK